MYDQVSQLAPVQQVDDIDEVHQLDPVHQVDHKDEHISHNITLHNITLVRLWPVRGSILAGLGVDPGVDFGQGGHIGPV